MKATRPTLSDPTAAAECFIEFVERSRALLRTPDSKAPAGAFLAFVDRAVPLLVEPLGEALDELRRRVMPLRRWMMPHDLLAVAGLSYAEDAYTELIAWALDPDTHAPSAVA